MKKTVLFLGAGVSKTFGYPLTSEILPGIIESLQKQRLFNEVTRDREVAGLYRKLLTHLLGFLSPGLWPLLSGRTGLGEAGELPLVTELLSQLDHFILSGQNVADWNFEVKDPMLKPGKISERWELSDLKILFEWAIIGIINKPQRTDSEVLSRFLSWIKEQNSGGRHFYSIISTNYDVALEWELLDWGQAWDADEEIDFGCSWRDPVIEDKSVVYLRPSKPVYRIFKLHGSTDWLKCDRCGFLYINPTEDIFELTFPNVKRSYNSCHCGYWPLKPVLITPSFIRQIQDPNLQEIWRNALEELRTADEWMIIGYSLPAEDFDIKSLLLRALAGREKQPSINVIQRSLKSKPRFDMFFGRGNYSFIEGGFESYIDAFFKKQDGGEAQARGKKLKTKK